MGQGGKSFLIFPELTLIQLFQQLVYPQIQSDEHETCDFVSVVFCKDTGNKLKLKKFQSCTTFQPHASLDIRTLVWEDSVMALQDEEQSKETVVVNTL